MIGKMDRLQLILDEIAGDSALQEERILADADARAALLSEKSEAETKAETAEMIAAARAKADQNLKVAQSSAAALKKRRILEEKSRLIRQAIDGFRKKIESLSDREYFAYFCRLLEETEPGGEILIAENEKKRDVSLFEAEKKEAEKRCGKKWTFSGAYTAGIESGILVRRGKIEENLSLEAVFAAREDELKDRLYACLFRETL